MKKVAILLSLGMFLAISCVEKESQVLDEQGFQVPNVSSTPCQQNKLKSSESSSKVDVKFTNKGVEITYYDFEVTCDFTTVDVMHTFVNGFLNITQKGSPSEAKCICYSDVSYTINGISQNEVNVIFINGEQVYCYNDKKDDDKDKDKNKNGVYVAVYEQNARGMSIAKLWKNGVVQDLTDGSKNGCAYSVFVK